MTQTHLASSSRKVEGQEAEIVDPVLSLCIDIARRLPEAFDEEAIAEKYPVEYTNSMNTVLRQEVVRFNRLLAFIKASLNDTRRAILGQLAMIPEIEKVHKAMAMGRLPEAWAKKSYPSLKPLGSYVNDFLARLAFLQRWIDDEEPTVYWLSGFYFTQSFLTSVLQNHSRKHQLPIDHLHMKFDVTGFEIEAQERPEMGVYMRVRADLFPMLNKLHERALIWIDVLFCISFHLFSVNI
jgi:dynein heavy chain, axonemal